MIEIPVALGKRAYTIAIEDGALDRAGELLGEFAGARGFIVITDTNVAPTQLPRLASSLARAGIAHEAIVLPAGEATKSWATLERLCDRLLALGVERGDCVIALGGGVIGDVAGFAAAIVKRGCGVIQIPTSLLAQVDSAIGGKTAINVGAGKNMIGAFHQPRLVLIDPDALDTLPPRELRAGYAEVVKYGLIDDAGFFAWCEANGAALIAGDRKALLYAIEHCACAKARIVAKDERETTGKRALLNLGHTFGHALEVETGFSDALLHGEAVASGMALAFRFSARRGLCPPGDADRVAMHLRAVSLPDSLASAGISAGSLRLIEHIARDKKMERSGATLVLASGIGTAFLTREVELAEVAEFLDNETRAQAGQ